MDTVASVEVADIVKSCGAAYCQYHRLGPEQRHALWSIEHCRTATLGGHLYQCAQCGHQHNAYNSCRNRHCPKCQSLAKEQWLKKRQEELLPVGYFHLVFTLPQVLHPLVLNNQKLLYSELLSSAAKTLLEVTAERLQARIGILAVLHTWSQTLTYHPHVHMVVPGGGLALDGDAWVSTRKKYLAPVRVLSRLFRAKFLARLKTLQNQLNYSGTAEPFAQPDAFQRLLDPLYDKDWVVYCKPPFATPRRLLAYLARYTHRIAITHHRLLSFDSNRVRFRYRDRRGQRTRTMELSAEEFLRRFLLHVLPKGFVRIRSYGLLANRNRNQSLATCRQELGHPAPVQDESADSWDELCQALEKKDPLLCPKCRRARMRLMGRIQPLRSRAPP